MAHEVHEFSHLPREPRSAGTRTAREARRAGEAPKVGVIYNPRSHRNRGRDLDSSAQPHIFTTQPGGRDQLPDALKELAGLGVELLVINGGDGTVRDVLTSGAPIFGEDWPTLAVLPKGKTNALTVDLEAPPDWSLRGAIDAFESGRRILRRPLRITPLDQDGAPLLGFILGAGAFTHGIRTGQSAHRLGAFNSLAVGVTTAWGLVQAILGGRENRWRRGAKIELLLGAQRVPLEHSGLGDPDHRQFMLSSTLERFPAGLKPFGALGHGIKLAVLDQTPRSALFWLPRVMLGRQVSNLRERGVHQVAAFGFEMTLDDQFILDGEAFPAGRYRVDPGPELAFVAP